MNIKDELNELIEYTEELLERYLPSDESDLSMIYEAMRYSLLAGGKRLRPILMLGAYRACGGSGADIEPFMCAIEMIHTYSLIHDDLPAMDNDDLRRGMPTNHIKFGEAAAILAGDALLNKAFEITSAAEYSDPRRALKAIAYLSSASGTEGMIGGQVLDIDAENRSITLDELKRIHSLKTGALIRAACVTGGIMAGADEERIGALRDYAVNLGIAFQIRDDILDVTGSEAELGKPIGSDAESGKNTYVSICGIERSEELVSEYTEAAEHALIPFGEDGVFLTELARYLVKRRK